MPLPPSDPPHLKIQPANAFVDDAGHEVFAECELCGRNTLER
jgi:hypothetical protein